MSRLPVVLVALLIRSGNSFLSPSTQPVVQRSSLLAVAGADIEQEQEDAPPQDRHDVNPLSLVYEICRYWDKSLAVYELLSS